ncbi:4'-phosphopantetheinyl transferase [Streptomyces globisporus]|uniref:4'-phosphopantetheinyl transferase family protein n=1 Tax=Streptomyces globisporus TaxID=1908 RepID=UPI0007C55463|nr:4'-phosphopantetheinyl transferase superfamily protein [Streptomyces globisporus]
MLASLLPPEVAAVEVRTDPLGIALFPEEEECVRDAVPKRRAEFTAVRWCARVAMTRLGLPPAPVVPGRRGAPGWDPSLAGSMTHCAGYRAAALAHRADVASLGIDAEPDEPLPEGILQVIALEPERRQVAGLLRSHPGPAWDRLLFSAKESVFKTWYPLTGRELGFEEALITLDAERRSFHVRLLADEGPAGDAPRVFSGRWAAERGVLVTAIAHTADVLVPACREAPRAVTTESLCVPTGKECQVQRSSSGRQSVTAEVRPPRSI